MAFRGKRRVVAEILEQYREGDEDRYYRFKVRLDCGHTVKVSAKNRYRKDEVPVVGYCTECAALDTGRNAA